MRRLVPLMLLVVCLPLALWALLPVPSGAQSSGEIQRKIDKKQSQIQYRKGRERVLTSDISRFSQRIDGLQSDIARLQNRQNRLEVDLANKRAELAQIQADLRKQRLRLQRLKARLAQARAALARRLRVGYMDDRPDIVTGRAGGRRLRRPARAQRVMQRIADQDSRIISLVRTAQGECHERRGQAEGLRVSPAHGHRRSGAAPQRGRRGQGHARRAPQRARGCTLGAARSCSRAPQQAPEPAGRRHPARRDAEEDRGQARAGPGRRSDQAGQRRDDLARQRADHVPVLRGPARGRAATPASTSASRAGPRCTPRSAAVSRSCRAPRAPAAYGKLRLLQHSARCRRVTPTTRASASRSARTSPRAR